MQKEIPGGLRVLGTVNCLSQQQVYLYYGNGGNGIGVAVSDSPTGPFKDPLPGRW